MQGTARIAYRKDILAIKSVTLADILIPLVIGFWSAAGVGFSAWFGLPGFRL